MVMASPPRRTKQSLGGNGTPSLRRKESQIIRSFVRVFCRKNHAGAGILCPSCHELLKYALVRLARCRYDPKPACRRCATHCYETQMRERIREVMRFSGRHFIRRGRVDWLVKYFLMNRQLSKNEVTLRRRRRLHTLEIAN
jgi:hypothetical protein